LGSKTELEIGAEYACAYYGANKPASEIVTFIFEPGEDALFCRPYELLAFDRCPWLTDPGHSLRRVLRPNRDLPALRPVSALPLRVLTVSASPLGWAATALSSGGSMIEPNLGTFDFISGSNTRQQLSDLTRKNRYDIVEFIVHGGGNPPGSALVFADKDNRPDLCDGNELYQQITPGGGQPPQFVLLFSCDGAGAIASAPTRAGPVAWHLLLSGVPSVIAMQTPITIPTALKARELFYDALLKGDTLDQAVSKMRPGVQPWYAPVLALREGHVGSLLSGSLRERLIKLADHNREVAGLYDRNTTPSDDLRTYLAEHVPQDDRRLLHNRREIAAKLIHAVRIEFWSMSPSSEEGRSQSAAHNEREHAHQPSKAN
jgi:hypothetical protein